MMNNKILNNLISLKDEFLFKLRSYDFKAENDENIKLLSPENPGLLKKAKKALNDEHIKFKFHEVLDQFHKLDNKIIVEGFQKDIVDSMHEIKSDIDFPKPLRVLLIEHEGYTDPIGHFYGYEEGENRIEKESRYIEYNYNKDIFEYKGKLDFKDAWLPILDLDSWTNHLLDTNLIFPYYLSSLYEINSYINLHKAFEDKKIQFLFRDFIPQDTLTFIYCGEHDCGEYNIGIISN